MKKLTLLYTLFFLVLLPNSFAASQHTFKQTDLSILGVFFMPSFPLSFNHFSSNVLYYHSHTATPQELAQASQLCPIFEIDLAWAHSNFHPKVTKNCPFIGHPESAYTKGSDSFPKDNVSLEEFQQFLKDHPSVKVLIDVKDEAVFPYLETLIQNIGSHRCLAHAAIKNWVILPRDLSKEPHWDQEDIELFALDDLLAKHGVPLIVNCRGFSDEHVERENLLQTIFQDVKKCKSVLAIGFYYPNAPLPKKDYLEKINQEGYLAWVNGNIQGFEEKLRPIKYIAMCDDMEKCTSFKNP